MLFATAELRRSKARFGLLTVGAGLLVFVLLFQQALLDSILDGMAGALTEQSAPVLVLAREAQRSVGGSIVTSEQLDRVAEAPGVADAAPFAVSSLSFRDQGSEEWHNASVLGYEPDRPGTPTGLRSGRLPEEPDEVVASAEDAPGRYRIGDTITVEPGGIPLVVVGLTEGSRMGVSPTLWVQWDMYQDLVRYAMPDAAEVFASVVAVRPADGVTVERLVRSLNRATPELEAMTREEAETDAPGRDAVRLGFLLVMGLSYLVVAVVIGFFFLTITLQKERSITTLRALGARGGYLVRCLMWQVALVAVGGLAIGGALLLAVVPLIRSTLVITADPAGMAVAAGPALAVALAGAVPSVRRVLRADASHVFTRPTLGGLG